MGDAGSLTLGYTLSYLVLKLSSPAYPGADGSGDMVLGLSTLVVPLFDVVRVVLIAILMMAVMYVAINSLLLKFMDVTLILAIDILVWIGMHLVINWRIRLWAKDHPEAAKSYVKPEEQDSLQK